VQQGGLRKLIHLVHLSHEPVVQQAALKGLVHIARDPKCLADLVIADMVPILCDALTNMEIRPRPQALCFAIECLKPLAIPAANVIVAHNGVEILRRIFARLTSDSVPVSNEGHNQFGSALRHAALTLAHLWLNVDVAARRVFARTELVVALLLAASLHPSKEIHDAIGQLVDLLEFTGDEIVALGLTPRKSTAHAKNI
jgi:hypothetical protein